MTSEKILSKRLKNLKNFEDWLENDEIPSRRNMPSDVISVKILFYKELIKTLAEQGYSKTNVFRFLKKQKKIDVTYQTFCRHLKRHEMLQYFTKSKKSDG